MPNSDSKETSSDSCGILHGLWRLYALLLVASQGAYGSGVLRSLRQAGMKVAHSTVWLTLDQMEEQGLVERGPATSGRAPRPIRITPAGRETLRRVRPALDGMLALIDEVLGFAPKAQDCVAAPRGPTRRSRDDNDIDGLATILDAVRTSERDRAHLRKSGVSLDSTGVPIHDPTSGSADIDHVTVIHQLGSVGPGAPSVALTILIDGTMTLRIEDPDGWQDIDFASVRAALFGVPVDAAGLLTAFQVQSADPTGFTLVQPVPLPPGLLFTLSLSLKDIAGHRSGLSRTRPTF